MIYVDSSVVLAQLLAEDRVPGDAFWEAGSLVSSRLTEYEVWVVLHGRALGASHGEPARHLLETLSLVELAPPVLARAIEPFPAPVRPLDALHLASLEYLRAQRVDVSLATYDHRMATAAAKLGIPRTALDGAG